jgi:crotonobetainyl-CoA:carnitine CoA-transferase CaiB-like acyl-CoA transferase
VRQLGVPVKLSRTPGDAARMPAPALGEHTEAVLRDAGLSEAEISALLASGAVAGCTPGPLAERGAGSTA